MKERVFNEEQRRVVARRLRARRKALGLSQLEVAYLSGYNESVVKNVERSIPAAAASYSAIAQTVGLTFESLLEFTSVSEEIQDLIDDLTQTNFTASFHAGTFAAEFSPTDPDSFAALTKMGLKITGDQFSLFDVLVKHKGNLDAEFAAYLKEMGLEKDQRLYIHSFAVLYYVFSALERWERPKMHLTLEKLMDQVQEFIAWQDSRNSSDAYRVDPVTGELVNLNELRQQRP